MVSYNPVSVDRVGSVILLDNAEFPVRSPWEDVFISNNFCVYHGRIDNAGTNTTISGLDSVVLGTKKWDNLQISKFDGQEIILAFIQKNSENNGWQAAICSSKLNATQALGGELNISFVVSKCEMIYN